MAANGNYEPEPEVSSMAIPIIPFVAGAVVGGLSVYFYRDGRARGAVGRTARGLTGKVKKTAGKVSDRVSEGFGGRRKKVSSKSDGSKNKKRKRRKSH